LLDDPKIVGELQEFVNDQSPRLFAVVQETFAPEDLKVVAWGMTTEKGAEVVSVHGGMAHGASVHHGCSCRCRRADSHRGAQSGYVRTRAPVRPFRPGPHRRWGARRSSAGGRRPDEDHQ
jgi:hypothetical protein